MKPPEVIAVPGAQEQSSPSPAADSLTAVYRMIAEWFLYPEEIDPSTLSDAALEDVLEHAAVIGGPLAGHLREFRAGYENVTLDEYLALLELNPRSPLYMGTYQFAEPTTCATAGVSDRNQYMIEIANIFGHFGLQIDSEMPDFLPALIEFLALTAGAGGEDGELRLRFIGKMVWPGVRLFAQSLAKEDTPYADLVEALTECLRFEAGDLPEPEPRGTGGNAELIQIEGVPST